MHCRCFNELEVTGPEREINRFLVNAWGWVPSEDESAEKEVAFSLNVLAPFPSETPGERILSWLGDIHPSPDWCLENWGTRRDVIEVSHIERPSDRCVIIAFETAESPPTTAFTNRIAPDFPDLSFCLRFEEGGAGFAGEWEWKHGRLVRQDDLSDEQ